MSSFVQIFAANTSGYIELKNNDVETTESKPLGELKACETYIIIFLMLRKNYFGPKSSLTDNNEWNALSTNNDDGQQQNCCGKMSKKSRISHKRAATASPLTSSIMIQKFKDHDKMLIQRGLVSAQGPQADDIFNLDEIGFDPNGRVLSTFSLRQKRSERRFSLQNGEHAPFWVSVIIAACTNGDILPPVIIHKGDTSTLIPGHFGLNLHPDYRVTCTPSGLCDWIMP